MKSLLFVVAHPDDLAFGIGGLALLLRKKYQLHVVCATKGERGIPNKNAPETAAIREQEEKTACKVLGADVDFLGKIDRELYADYDVCKRVAGIINETQPVAIFTIWPVDHHPDHSAISEITKKSVFISHIETEIIYCEEADHQTKFFLPSVYVDISKTIDQKLNLVRCHQSQNIKDKLAQACLDKASLRGSQSGFAFAEGYLSFSHNNSSRLSIFNEISEAKSIIQQ